jgi:hypothetical protein
VSREIVIDLPRLHRAQRQIATEAKQFNVLAIGRRAGKTTFGIERLIRATLQPTAYPVAWFAPTYRQLTSVWRDVKRRLGAFVREKDESLKRLYLLNGSEIHFWSLTDPDAGRGYRYYLVIVDEAGMIRALQQAWSEAIMPTLTDFAGSAWFLSTPKGLNYFKTLFDLGRDPAQPDWASWQMPSHCNPYLPRSFIDKVRAFTLDQAFRQEYLAEFLAGLNAVFRNVLQTARWQSEPVQGHEYCIGVDWARTLDYTVFTVIDATARALVHVDRFQGVGYALQVGRLRALRDRFRPYRIVAEENSLGGPLVEALQDQGLPVEAFQTTNKSKSVVVDRLALAMEQGKFSVLSDDHPLGAVVVSELLSYEQSRLPGGAIRYEAPSGQNDDCVMSLALGYDAVADSYDSRWFN